MEHTLSFFESQINPNKRSPELRVYPQFKKKICQPLSNWPSPALVLHSLDRTEEPQSDGDEDMGAVEPIFKSSAMKQNTIALSFNHSESGTGNYLWEPRRDTQITFLPDETQSIKHVGDEDKEGKCSKSKLVDEFLADELVEKSFSEAEFLRKVLVRELGDDSGFNYKTIVIAVHAVLLDSGFVSFDPNANAVMKGFHFPYIWPSGAFTISLCYTLPEIANNVPVKQTQSFVVLKFQSVGKLLTVYGSVNSSVSQKYFGNELRMVHLDEDQLLPYLNVWANCGVNEHFTMRKCPEEVVLKFWRTIKDCIALPLLIDLCENAGLPLPPCFAQLPCHLKFKILELLSNEEITRASHVCSELRQLSKSEYLWCGE